MRRLSRFLSPYRCPLCKVPFLRIYGTGWRVPPFAAVFIWAHRSAPIWRKRGKTLFCFMGRTSLQNALPRRIPRGMDGRHRGKDIRFLSHSMPPAHAAGGVCTNGMVCPRGWRLMLASRLMCWRLLPHGLSATGAGLWLPAHGGPGKHQGVEGSRSISRAVTAFLKGVKRSASRRPASRICRNGGPSWV